MPTLLISEHGQFSSLDSQPLMAVASLGFELTFLSVMLRNETLLLKQQYFILQVFFADKGYIFAFK